MRKHNLSFILQICQVVKNIFKVCARPFLNPNSVAKRFLNLKTKINWQPYPFSVLPCYRSNEANFVGNQIKTICRCILYQHSTQYVLYSLHV